MSDKNGADNTQNSQGQQGGQQPDTSKIFSNGYNEGVSTQEKRVLQKFSNITGQDFDSIDAVYDWGKNTSSKLAESVSDPTATDEYKDLQNRFKSLQSDYEEAQNRVQSIQSQYQFDSMFNETVSTIKQDAEFKIPENDVKDLFQAKYKVENKDGTKIVKKKSDDTPVMGENGYKPLNEVLTEFSKNYTTAKAKGTGGGSGDGQASAPKYSDFQKAVDAGDDKRSQQLLAQYQEAGGRWADE